MVRSYLIRDELSGTQALEFAASVAARLDGVDRVELSMRRAGLLDVTGVAVLVRMYGQLARQGRALALTDVPAHIAAQLQLVGLSRVLATPAVSDAVASSGPVTRTAAVGARG
ncbi:MAG: STAS domain-containing protein [Myxococcales bacterium]|nr:STAS domain-containing protein [Myxococcales bacterium]MCB9531311.1 STAS domain-containing protein [Myxococcales bacterium]